MTGTSAPNASRQNRLGPVQPTAGRHSPLQMTDDRLLTDVRAIHAQIRAAVLAQCEGQPESALAEATGFAGGDTIYAIDRVSETLLIDLIEERVAAQRPVMLIAEGLPEGRLPLPRGSRSQDCELVLIVDPIDGTRGLMYQKRPAWILTGIGPWHGPTTRLRDLTAAVQTEIPLVKQHLCDQFWAARGQGLSAARLNRLTGTAQTFRPQPSQATSLAHGFAMLSRFFPPGRDLLAAIDDRLMEQLLGPITPGQAPCFEDQYISTGGQFAELLYGHDRFNADLRPLLTRTLAKRGQAAGLACHPYDVCTALLLEEAGVPLTDPSGATLDCPLDTDTPVAWVAYANAVLRQLLEGLLQTELRHAQLL